MTRRRRTKIRVLGVDPSLVCTGLALPDGTTIDLSNTKTGWDRIQFILSRLKNILMEQEVTHVALEGYAFAAKGRVFDLAELGGCMKLLFLSEGLPIVLVPAATLKMYAAGKGNASKEIVMKEIKRRWGRSFVSSDRADAFALQQLGMDYLEANRNLRNNGIGYLEHESRGDVRALGKVKLINEPNLQSFANIG